MTVIDQLKERSNNSCELCSSETDLKIFIVPPRSDETIDNTAFVCSKCTGQIEGEVEMEANHWRCLNDSMWNENAAVQVIAWRMLTRLKGEGWPSDLLDMMYLEDETLSWAKATGEDLDESEKIIHKDSNGVTLASGDSVVIIKDLNVKGGGFTAKRGTAVRNISLVHDNAEHIEGRVNGQQIVILTQYTKKS
jgi:protein PhnA